MKIEITHPDKIIYPKIKVTKLDIAQYYESIESRMLPYIKNRLLSVLKCPQGRQKKCFFQKHPNQKKTPSGIKTLKVKGAQENHEYFYIHNKTGLFYLVQQNVIEIHPWGSRVSSIENPDVLFFDLDPSPSVEWKEVVFLAHFMREQLKKLKLKSFVKTTGGKGLHIVVPISPKYTWDQAKEFSKNFAFTVASLQPKLCTSSFSSSARKGKILIDYVRNTRGATAVAPYSLRAREGAPISMPISWDSLTAKIKPDSYTITNALQAIQKRKSDPWQGFWRLKQSLNI